MFKGAGLLDTPQSTLPKDVWDVDTLKIHPHIREHIFSVLDKFVPREILKDIFIIGSITGYKYSDTSDIDINVFVDVPREDLQE